MKKTILAICVIATATITFISCDWFSSKNKSTPTLIGQWKVDSLYPSGKDSNSLAIFLYALVKKEKDSSIVEFNKDSTFRELYSKDSIAKKYYVKDNQLFVQEDSTYSSYQLSFPKDSTANLISKDSLVIVLRKK
jgi:hypothetical protein